MKMNNIDFKKGTLSFWVPPGSLDYGDNKFIYLFNYVSEEGHLKIVKNRGNGIEIRYMYNGFGYSKFEVNAEDLNNEERHNIVVTWSISDGLVKLYIDGVERQTSEINLDAPPTPNNSY